MGTISSPSAQYSLQAIGTPTKTQSAGATIIGVSPTTLALTGATKAYCVSATLATSGDTLILDPSTGLATPGTTPVLQVETATVVVPTGAATASGNLTVTVTAADVTGSPIVFSIAVVIASDGASSIAGKIRLAFLANSALTAVYNVGGTGANVTLPRKVAANNDSTLNIAITAGLGVSAITNSTNTTAGVGGVVLTNNTGDGNDWEGVPIEIARMHAILVKNISGTIAAVYDSTILSAYVPTGAIIAAFYPADLAVGSSLLITANAEDCEVELTIIGS